MAKSTALQVIVKKAKALKKQHPHKFDRLKKAHRWSKGYIKQASALYAGAHKKKSAPKKRRKKVGVRKVAAKKAARKPIKKRATHKKSTAGRKLVRYVEKTSTERVMAGKKHRRRRARTVHHAGSRRRVGKSEGGNTKLLVGLAIGAGLIYLLTKKSTPTTYTASQLPPVRQTTNYTRNTQSQDIVNYAIAAGLAITAITGLIDRLNNSTDQQVTDIYDHVNTTGDVGAWA